MTAPWHKRRTSAPLILPHYPMPDKEIPRASKPPLRGGWLFGADLLRAATLRRANRATKALRATFVPMAAQAHWPRPAPARRRRPAAPPAASPGTTGQPAPDRPAYRPAVPTAERPGREPGQSTCRCRSLLKWRPAGQQVIGHGTERVNVAPRSTSDSPITCSGDMNAGVPTGPRPQIGRLDVATVAPVRSRAAWPRRPGLPAAPQNVRRLDVAMDQAGRVRLVQGPANLPQQIDDPLGRQRDHIVRPVRPGSDQADIPSHSNRCHPRSGHSQKSRPCWDATAWP